MIFVGGSAEEFEVMRRLRGEPDSFKMSTDRFEIRQSRSKPFVYRFSTNSFCFERCMFVNERG